MAEDQEIRTQQFYVEDLIGDIQEIKDSLDMLTQRYKGALPADLTSAFYALGLLHGHLLNLKEERAHAEVLRGG